MKKIQLGLLAIGMMVIGQFNAQEDKKSDEQPHHHPKMGFFTKMDTNKDGVVTLDEMKVREGDEANKEARFKKLDINADGKITKEELDKVQASRKLKKAKHLSPDERFAKWDKNSDGAITIDEMKVKDGDEAARDARFKKMDTNADGRITQEELAAKRTAHMKKRKAKKCDGTKCQKPQETK